MDQRIDFRDISSAEAFGDAIGCSLDAAALREIDRIIAEHVVDPVGPEFMAPPSR